MSRIENILLKARRVLGDTLKERWSDEELLSLLDEGQTDIAKQTLMLREYFSLNLIRGQAFYTLPVGTLDIMRATFKDYPIPLKTSSYMDNYGLTGRVVSSIPHNSQSSYIVSNANSHWQTSTTTGDVLALIFDKLDRLQMRVWPIPMSEELEENLATFSGLYGVSTDITNYAEGLDPYGLVSTVVDTQENPIEYEASANGVLTGMTYKESIIIQRAYMPIPLETVDDELELDSLADTALKFYVIGQAFKDDKKEENRVVGNSNMKRYMRELEQIGGVASTNSVSAEHHSTEYNGMS